MTEARTGAERYLEDRLEEAEYAAAYSEARERVSQIDAVMRALERRREEMAVSKAELARRAGIKPEAVRRLFSAERRNPTLATIVALADALELDVVPQPRLRPATPPSSATRARSGARRTRRQTV
jgi:DNA-binding phage protein